MTRRFRKRPLGSRGIDVPELFYLLVGGIHVGTHVRAVYIEFIVFVTMGALFLYLYGDWESFSPNAHEEGAGYYRKMLREVDKSDERSSILPELHYICGDETIWNMSGHTT